MYSCIHKCINIYIYTLRVCIHIHIHILHIYIYITYIYINIMYPMYPQILLNYAKLHPFHWSFAGDAGAKSGVGGDLKAVRACAVAGKPQGLPR